VGSDAGGHARYGTRTAAAAIWRSSWEKKGRVSWSFPHGHELRSYGRRYLFSGTVIVERRCGGGNFSTSFVGGTVTTGFALIQIYGSSPARCIGRSFSTSASYGAARAVDSEAAVAVPAMRQPTRLVRERAHAQLGACGGVACCDEPILTDVPVIEIVVATGWLLSVHQVGPTRNGRRVAVSARSYAWCRNGTGRKALTDP